MRVRVRARVRVRVRVKVRVRPLSRSCWHTRSRERRLTSNWLG